jgi:hypothetical protein
VINVGDDAKIAEVFHTKENTQKGMSLLKPHRGQQQTKIQRTQNYNTA